MATSRKDTPSQTVSVPTRLVPGHARARVTFRGDCVVHTGMNLPNARGAPLLWFEWPFLSCIKHAELDWKVPRNQTGVVQARDTGVDDASRGHLENDVVCATQLGAQNFPQTLQQQEHTFCRCCAEAVTKTHSSKMHVSTVRNLDRCSPKRKESISQ